MLYLVSPDDLSLLEDLHGVQLSIVNLLDQHDLSVGSLADDSLNFEVFLVHGPCLLLLVFDHGLILLFNFFVFFHLLLGELGVGHALVLSISSLVLRWLFVNLHFSILFTYFWFCLFF